MQHESNSNWGVISARVPPEMIVAIEQYGESVGEKVLSLMVRSLIAAGLEAKGRGDHHAERTLIDNAKAAAAKRMSDLMSAAMEAYWDLESLDPSDDSSDDDDDDDDDDEDDEPN